MPIWATVPVSWEHLNYRWSFSGKVMAVQTMRRCWILWSYWYESEVSSNLPLQELATICWMYWHILLYHAQILLKKAECNLQIPTVTVGQVWWPNKGIQDFQVILAGYSFLNTGVSDDVKKLFLQTISPNRLIHNQTTYLSFCIIHKRQSSP